MKIKLFIAITAVLLSNFSFGLAQQRIRVACVGNSITAGHYPSKMQKTLGVNYSVENFGVAARTMLLKGDYPYMNEEKFQQSLAFEPDIVIIALGTNDSKSHNWKYGDEFEANLITMIASYKSLSSKPKIYLCRPMPAFEIRYGINNLVLQKEIYPKIRKVSKKEKCRLIDLYTPFSDSEVLFPDKIHPNEKGAEKMAEIITKAIKTLK